MTAMRFHQLLSIGLLAGTASIAATTASHRSVLPWIEDDYERAIAEAKARKVPIFVEAWAPW
jgi:hypothetical protein